MQPQPRPALDSGALRGDCRLCFGLCCVAPAFAKSSEFALDKPAGQPCPNLQRDFSCGQHTRLREIGFPGCTHYDCFGAGQRVSQHGFGGRSWQQAPELAARMFAAFSVMRQLHELLWYLSAARALPAAQALFEQLRAAQETTEQFAALDPDALLRLDVAAHRDATNLLLREASELARRGTTARDCSGANLIAADLKRLDLHGANLRGACLIGADLREVDLTLADLCGADLRAAKLAGSDLRASLFVTQAQLDAAQGDARTKLPPGLARPLHWGAHGLALTALRTKTARRR